MGESSEAEATNIYIIRLTQKKSIKYAEDALKSSEECAGLSTDSLWYNIGVNCDNKKRYVFFYALPE